MPRNSSKTWLKSLIARKSSAHPSADGLTAIDSLSIEETALDEIIVEEDSLRDNLSSPRAVLLEADRQARLEQYRQETARYEQEDELHRQTLQTQQQRRQQQKIAQRQALERLQHQSSLLSIGTDDSRSGVTASGVTASSATASSPDLADLNTASIEVSQRISEIPVDPVSRSGSSFGNEANSIEDLDTLNPPKSRRENRQARRNRRRQALRRARRSLTPKQQLQRSIQYFFRALSRGILWIAQQILKLVIAILRRIYQWVAPIVRRHHWKFIIGGISSVIFLTAGSALWWMSRVPPAPKCDQLPAWAVDAERLSCAQLATESGSPDEIFKGIALVETWERGHPLYNQAQRSLAQWTEQLLVVARQKLESQDLDGAIDLAKRIPKNSPLYSDVQREVNDWQEARNLGQKLHDRMQVALKKQAWDEASGYLAKLANINDPTWQKRLVELRRTLETEKMAGSILKQARDFAKSRPPEQWGSAIALTDAINRKTFVWEAAQKDIEQWRNQVFDLAIVQLLKQKKTESALSLVKTIPSNIALTDEQHAFIHLAQASAIAEENQNLPLLQQWGQLALAQQLIARIPTGSQFHQPAAALLPDLQARGEDVAQIQVARAIAGVGSVAFLQGAIAQAEQVQPKRPRRVEAQTLVAQWKKGLQQLEDRPLIAQGEQLAKQGNLESYRQAVALIDRVGKTRKLYADAQRRRSEWIAQIQTIEDRPILASAKAQAASGNLGQAIQTAQKIASGRALYAEAQREAGGWADQIQAIADRAAMERAAALAARGNLSQAIDVASSVSSNAVSGEARSSISQWSAEREVIRRSQAPVAPVEDAPIRRREDPAPPPVEAPVEPAPIPPPDRSPAAPPEPVNEPAPPPPLDPEPSPPGVGQ